MTRFEPVSTEEATALLTATTTAIKGNIFGAKFVQKIRSRFHK